MHEAQIARLEQQQREEMFRWLSAVVDSTDDAVITKTLEGVITGWNPAAQAMFGYAAVEAIGRSISMLVPPDRAGEEAQILVAVSRGEHVRQFETMRVRKSGEVFPVSITVSPIRGFDAAAPGTMKIVGASKIARDISERKRAEALAQREQLLSGAMMESMPGLFYLYDETGHFLRWNRNFTSVSGYSDEEIGRMHPRDFFAAADRPLLEARIAEVFESGESSVELPFRARDGSVTPYYFTGRRMAYDGAVCLIGMGINISRRVQAEAGLRASEERYRSTIDSILEGCQLLGFDWRYLYLNDAAAVQNRRPNQELLGRTMPESWPGIEATPVFAMLRRCLRERIALHEENEFVFPDGAKGWFDVRCQPVPEGIFVLSIDITERKQAQQALEEHVRRLRAMSRQLLQVQDGERRLLARELHDTVGQELTALSLNLGIIRAGMPQEVAATLGGRLDDSMNLLEEASRHLREVMVELRPTGLDELGLLAALEDHARRVAARSGFKLSISGAEPAPRLDHTVEIALFRIAQEALNNAVKHARASAVGIALADAGGRVRLEVTDDGTGIDPARAQAPGAHGMGMTTMRERAEAIGAQFGIESAPGKGTRVTVDLPRTAAPAA